MHPIRRRALAVFLAGVALLTTTAVRAETQQNVLDRFLINELQSRYALAHDLTDPVMYASVFTEDAELPWSRSVAGQGS